MSQLIQRFKYPWIHKGLAFSIAIKVFFIYTMSHRDSTVWHRDLIYLLCMEIIDPTRMNQFVSSVINSVLPAQTTQQTAANHVLMVIT